MIRLLIFFISLFSITYADPLSDVEIEARRRGRSMLSLAEEFASSQDKALVETALSMLETGRPVGFRANPFASIEEAASIRRIIFSATRKLYYLGVRASTFKGYGGDLFKGYGGDLESKSPEGEHQRLVHTLILERLQAFESEPLQDFKNNIVKGMDVADLEKGRFTNDDPRLVLAKYIHRSKEKPLSEKEWQMVYYALWSVAGAQDRAYVYKHYNGVIQVLQENWADFDSSLQRSIIEFDDIGFFTDAQARIIKPVSGDHRVLVFGGEDKGLYRADVYVVNIFNDKPVDMLADMNNPEQLKSIPDKHFEVVYTEHIPAGDHYNPQFFKNASRILQDSGELVINNMEYMQNPPYNIGNIQAYFQKNGFQGWLGECTFPRNKPRPGMSHCWHLKKIQ